MDNKFNQQKYQIRKKVLSLAGATLQIFDADGQEILFSKMKAFKLKEDIRLYSGEDMQDEYLTIHARSIIDFSATYDVFDAKTSEKIGAFRKKGLKSVLKDEWMILDNNDFEIGLIKEDHLALALLRRFLTNLVPQRYHVELSGKSVGTFQQNFNPFVVKLNLDFSMDNDHLLDRRLGIAAGILLCAIEGKQK
ncbi:MAG: hypothetical protein WD907_03185 [Bacilli bacterium]